MLLLRALAVNTLIAVVQVVDVGLGDRHGLSELARDAAACALQYGDPARAVEFVHYDAPRPRTDKTLSEAGFIATKAHCLKLFQREVRRG